MMKKRMNIHHSKLQPGDVVVHPGPLVDINWVTVDREIPPVEIRAGDIIDYSSKCKPHPLDRVKEVGDAKIVFEKGGFLWAHSEERPSWRVYREVTE